MDFSLIAVLFGQLMEESRHTVTLWEKDSYNALITMKNGHKLSIGWGPRHYSNNRGAVGTELDLLFNATLVEVAHIPTGYKDIDEVRGWVSAQELRDWISELETE
jgi:hypothetical protein